MKRVLAVAAAVLVAACGSGSSSPSAPETNVLSAPSSFTITLQQASMTANTVSFSWSSTGATTYRILIGSAAGQSDVLSADVTGTTYTWTGPRTANLYYARVAALSGGQLGSVATELPLFTIDMRYVIDALYFSTGPMSENPGIQPPGELPVLIWADGATINVIVTEESGAVSLAAAQSFVTDYLAAMSNHITVNVTTTPTKYTGVGLLDIPLNDVIIRVDRSVCSDTGVIACAWFGPLPSYGRSFVNLNGAPTATTPGGSVAIAHEIGHAFGLHHLRVNSSARAELRFLMNPTLLVSQLSEVEKTAMAAARAGGLRAGMTRADAVDRGLVFATANPASSSLPPIVGPTLNDTIEPRIIK